MKYRKKPVVIDAMLWVGDLRAAMAFITVDFSVDDLTRALYIPTLEGEMRADLGDWIIKGVKGEFYPCRDDIFEATYEEVDDDA